MVRILLALFACCATLLAHPAAARDLTRKQIADLSRRLDRVMEQQVAEGFSGIAYVSRDGHVLLRRGFGYADRKTRTLFDDNAVVDIGSFAKGITAAAAVRLALDGRISLDDPLSKHFDQVPADKAGITVRQLLSHSSGFAQGAFPDDFTFIPQDEWLRRVFEKPLVHAPGTRYLYSNDGVGLVAVIIERIVGVPYRQWIRETLFLPNGMTHTGWYDDEIFDDPSVLVATGYRNGKDDGAPNAWPGPYWALLGNGGVLWTIDDMLRWHRAVNHDFLTDEARALLFAPAISDGDRFLYPDETGSMHYAQGWRVGRSPCGDARRSHTGTGISHNIDYRYYVDRDLLIYVASNRLDRDHNDKQTVFARKAAVALTSAMMDGCP